MPSIKRKPARVAYYARNIALDMCPPVLFQRRLHATLARATDYDRDYLAVRLNYYNKLTRPADLPADARRVGRISMGASMYYYDLKEHARYFPRSLRLNYVFGDLRRVPARPAIVKSRPVGGDNRNSVVMNLDKFRHFYLPPDRIAFADKKPVAVWRGSRHNPVRVELVRRYRGRPLCDVGLTDVPASHAGAAGFLPPTEQMAFRYIISVEGNDVASNLKWIMASNSLCIMAAPSFETWFMEGRLEAGRHYVEVARDFADLEDKILHYEAHPDEALEIVANAQAYVAQFRDARREQVISLLVLYKYFVATGQLDASGALSGLMTL